MAESLTPVPSGIDPELRRHLQSIANVVGGLAGLVRSSADKSQQYLTMERLVADFPELVRHPDPSPGVVYEDGVYADGVYVTEADANGSAWGYPFASWVLRPLHVSAVAWMDAP